MITCGVLLHSTGPHYFSPHQRCYYTSQGGACCSVLGLINVCERKNLVSTLVPPLSADQADAGRGPLPPRPEFEVFCSTDFGFESAAAGGSVGTKNVKIIIIYLASDKKSPVH